MTEPLRNGSQLQQPPACGSKGSLSGEEESYWNGRLDVMLQWRCVAGDRNPTAPPAPPPRPRGPVAHLRQAMRDLARVEVPAVVVQPVDTDLLPAVLEVGDELVVEVVPARHQVPLAAVAGLPVDLPEHRYPGHSGLGLHVVGEHQRP